MNLQIDQPRAGGPLFWRGELDVYAVPALREDLLERAASGVGELEIDLADITQIDCAGLQLMLLAKRQPGLAVRFCHHAEPVLRLIDLANLGQSLGDPLLIQRGSA